MYMFRVLLSVVFIACAFVNAGKLLIFDEKNGSRYRIGTDTPNIATIYSYYGWGNKDMACLKRLSIQISNYPHPYTCVGRY